MKMNKFLTIVILVVFSLNSTLTGQMRSYDRYERYDYNRVPMFGIKGGLNFSDLTTPDEMGDVDLKTGFHAGIFVEIPVSPGISFRPEVLYSKKGTGITYQEDFFGIELATGESNFNLNYIDVPLYLVFYLTDNLNIFLGPYAGFLLNANVETDTELLDFLQIEGNQTIDRDHFKDTEIGLSGGIGLAFGNVTLGANYNWGLTQVADSDAAEILLGDSRNMVIQVSLGLRF
jgi:hypothetical protein